MLSARTEYQLNKFEVKLLKHHPKLPEFIDPNFCEPKQGLERSHQRGPGAAHGGSGAEAPEAENFLSIFIQKVPRS